MIYVYCICPASAGGAPLGRGLGGAKLRALPVGQLAAVYSRHRSLQIRPEAEQVLGHDSTKSANRVNWVKAVSSGTATSIHS